MSRRLAVAALLFAACGPKAGGPRGPSVEPDVADHAVHDGGVAPMHPTDGGAPVVRPTPPPRPAKVKLTIRSVPPKAHVAWGKLQLGPTPIQIDRPRDSGPVDIIVRSDGYLTLHTRLYTVRNESMTVRLTKNADRMSILGAKKEPPPDSPDGGAPPP